MQGKMPPMDSAKSPTSKMMTMNRQNTHAPLQQKIPKQSQKIIDFDNMSSFDSEIDSRSKTKSYLGHDDFNKDTQDILSRKCRLILTPVELMKKNQRTVNKSNESETPTYTGSRPFRPIFGQDN